MAQEVVKTFKELVDRLKAANVPGGIFEHVKLIEGPTEVMISDNDLPCIIYEILRGGFSANVCFPKGVRFTLTVLLTVMTHASSGYFDDERAGIIDYCEKIMSVVDGTGAGSLTGNNNWTATPQYRIGSPFVDGLKYTYPVEIELESARYTKGEL